MQPNQRQPRGTRRPHAVEHALASDCRDLLDLAQAAGIPASLVLLLALQAHAKARTGRPKAPRPQLPGAQAPTSSAS